jgi:formylmethanofuran dehydrogenase subunit B
MVTDVVCPFCGTLCDDIDVEVEDGKIKNVKHACIIGARKFLGQTYAHRPKPRIVEDGQAKEVSIDEAIDRAAEILVEAKKPLLYGWATCTCEAIEKGIALAEEVGGIIDGTTSVCHGPSVLAIQEVGYPTNTLGDVKNRADIIIYWGANPMHAHPRHLSRYSIFPRGYFRERGAQDRELIVVDSRKTDTAKLANTFIQVEPGKDYELVSAMRTYLNGHDIPDEVAGVKKEDIVKLVDKLKSCQFGILFFGMGLTMTPGKHRNINNAISLVQDLNKHTKFSIMAMRGHFNVTGFGEVLTWTTGFPFAVDLTRGYPRYNPGETASNDVLSRRETDAAFIIASDPVAHFPRQSVEHLARIPLIAIVPEETPTTQLADVVIPAAFTGIEVEGTAYRMDRVPIRVRKVVDPPEGVLTDEEILERIHNRVKELKAR